jgi:enediyne biosynthesis protein E4
LPAPSQWAPVYGIAINDFNADGNCDIVLNGNEYNMLPVHGRIDALNGLVLQGDGKGHFVPLSILQSGLFVPGNGKALVQFPYNNRIALAASQNLGSLQLFQHNRTARCIALRADEQSALVQLKNGLKRKEEFYGGSSFQSQSARFIQLNDAVQSVQLFNGQQPTRVFQ